MNTAGKTLVRFYPCPSVSKKKELGSRMDTDKADLKSSWRQFRIFKLFSRWFQDCSAASDALSNDGTLPDQENI